MAEVTDADWQRAREILRAGGHHLTWAEELAQAFAQIRAEATEAAQHNRPGAWDSLEATRRQAIAERDALQAQLDESYRIRGVTRDEKMALTLEVERLAAQLAQREAEVNALHAAAENGCQVLEAINYRDGMSITEAHYTHALREALTDTHTAATAYIERIAGEMRERACKAVCKDCNLSVEFDTDGEHKAYDGELGEIVTWPCKAAAVRALPLAPGRE